MTLVLILLTPMRVVLCEGHRPTVTSLTSCKVSPAFAGACLAMLVATQAPAAALECPVTHRDSSSAAIKGTRAQTAQLTTELAADETGNTTIATVWELKHKYPNAGFDEIVNYMVTAYCPIVAKNASLSDEEKQDRLKHYSQQIAALAIK